MWPRGKQIKQECAHVAACFRGTRCFRWLKETTEINNLVSLTQLTLVTVTGSGLALPSDAPLQLNAEIFVGSISPSCEGETCHEVLRGS